MEPMERGSERGLKIKILDNAILKLNPFIKSHSKENFHLTLSESEIPLVQRFRTKTVSSKLFYRSASIAK